MIRVATQEAEDACALINSTLAAHRETIGALTRQDSERRIARLLDHGQLQRQSTFIRLVSITESFVVARLVDRIGGWADTSPDHVKDLWSSEVLNAIMTWSKLQDSYRKWLAVTDSTMWKPLDGLTEARNTVAHGLGALTRVQLKKQQSTLSRMANAGIVPVDGRVDLDESTLESAAGICRNFIGALDSLTRLQ